MEKKCIFIVFILLFGCSGRSSMPVFEHDRFSISYPAGWQINSSQENALVRISAPEDTSSSTLAPAITVSTGANTATGKELTEKSILLLKETIDDFNLISQDTIKADGASCSRITFSGNLASSRIIWSILIFDGKDDDFFISCTAPVETFENYQDLFTKSQKSFKLE